MMGPFLAGFCSELLKTAFADSSPTPVPATGSPTTQRPTGAAAAPPRPGERGPFVGNYSRAPKEEQWRPSPKYTPRPEPAEPAPKKTGGGGRRRSEKGVEWQRIKKPAGTSSTQTPDVRTSKEKAWGALPKAPRPAEVGDTYATRPDLKPPKGISEKQMTSSHIPNAKQPATVRDLTDLARKETQNVPMWAANRPGGGAAYAKDRQMTRDLMVGSRQFTDAERFMRTQGGAQNQVQGPARGGGFAAPKDPDQVKRWLEAGQAPAPPPPKSNNELMAEWESGGRQGPKPVMFE